MKYLICLMLLLISTVAYATTVELQWDANPPANKVQGYAIFDKANEGAPLWSGNALTCIVTVPDDRTTTMFARAWNWSNIDPDTRVVQWSGNSNEVTYTPVIAPPEPPKNLTIIQRIVLWLKDRFPNWSWRS